MKTNHFGVSLAAVGVCALLLAGCGGGGGSGDGGAANLTISGAAATGAAISSGNVSVNCATGTATATTNAQGQYSVSISGGVLPCVLRVTQGSTVLHSVVESGAGTTVTANITPLSELLVAELADDTPANFFANFDAAAQAQLTAGAIATARTAVAAIMQGTADLTGVDPLKDALVVGNGLDQKLDALAAAQTAGQSTLTDLVSAIVANGSITDPVKRLLQATSVTCKGLRSGRYRVIDPNQPDPSLIAQVYDLNAVTLTATLWDGTTVGSTANGGCSFIDSDGIATAVSSSGFTAARYPSGPASFMALFIPEQNIPLSDLAGTWNALEYARANGSSLYAPSQHYFTLDAAGKFSNGFFCIGLNPCAAWTGSRGDITVNAGGNFPGGLQYTDAAGTHRVFAFKSADGHTTLVTLYANQQGFAVATKQAPRVLPTVNDVVKFWDLSMGADSTASAISDLSRTVTAVDATATPQTITCLLQGLVDTLLLNSPRVGLYYRPATPDFSELILLTLPGAGVHAYTSVAVSQNFFGFSVEHP